MLWFVLTLLILMPFFVFIYNHITNSKIPLFVAVLAPFFFLTIVTIPFTLSRSINFFYLQIICYSVLVLFVAWIIFKSLMACRKNINKISWKNLWKPILQTLTLIVIFLVFLFYTSTNFDTTYYVMISTNFLASQFNFSGLSTDALFSSSYLATPMYFVYSVLFPNDITASYHTINAMVYALLIVSIFFEIISFRKTKLHWLNYVFIFLSIIVVSLVNVNWKSSANTDFQTLTIIIVILNILKIDKNAMNDLNQYIPPISMIFFSLTGFILSIPLIICIFIFIFFFKKKYYTLWSVVFLMFPICLLILLFLVQKEGLINLFLLLPALLIFIYLVWIKKATVRQIFFKQIISKKSFIIRTLTNIYFLYLIIPTVILIASITYAILCIQFDYFNILNIIYFVIIYTLTTGLCFYNKKYSHGQNYFLSILLISSLCIIFTIPYHLVSSILTTSESNWRLIYNFIGIANFNIFYIFLFMIFCLIDFQKIFLLWSKYKLINNYFWFSFFNHQIIKTLSLNIMLLPLIINSSLHIIIDAQYNFKSTSIYYAVNKITYNDRKFLEGIDFKNFKQSYATDSPVNEYLKGGVNVSQFLTYFLNNESIWNHPHPINFSGYSQGLKFWNLKNGLNYVVDDKFINEAFSNAISKLKDDPKKSLHFDNIEEINYIIITKEYYYYWSLINFLTNTPNTSSKTWDYELIYNGEKISVLNFNKS